jgi:hypothetical protein
MRSGRGQMRGGSDGRAAGSNREAVFVNKGKQGRRGQTVGASARIGRKHRYLFQEFHYSAATKSGSSVLLLWVLFGI